MLFLFESILLESVVKSSRLRFLILIAQMKLSTLARAVFIVILYVLIALSLYQDI